MTRLIRVLLVEDDEDDYVLTLEISCRDRRDAVPAGLGKTYEAGVQAIRKAEHDVYLLDYRLNGRTGLELLMQMTAEGEPTPGDFAHRPGRSSGGCSAMWLRSRLPHQGAD